MLKAWFEAKNNSRSILELLNCNTKLGLHDYFVTMALQLPFFLDINFI